MNKRKISSIIRQAEAMCSRTGGRLTEKRRRILELLLSTESPLSAYEIADTYVDTYGDHMPTMSVYRILEFLESEKIVHKLSTANKYIACSHIECSHAHDAAQFLICSECKTAKEIDISNNVLEELNRLVTNAGFFLGSSQLELQCLCKKCSTKAA